MKKYLSIICVFVGNIIFVISFLFLLSDIFVNNIFSLSPILLILLSIIFYCLGIIALVKNKHINFLKSYHYSLLIILLFAWLMPVSIGIAKSDAIYWSEFILASISTLPFIIIYCLISSLINEYYKLKNSYLIILNSFLGITILASFFIININYYTPFILFIIFQIFISIILKKIP